MKKRFTFIKKMRYNRTHNEFLISIPSKIRDRLDLEEGQFFKVELKEDHRITITKINDVNEKENEE